MRVIISGRFPDFHAKAAFLTACVRDDLCQCDSCDNRATHIFWQDEAEYYYLCEDHRTHEQQWTGSTRGSSSFAFATTLPFEKAVSYIAKLPRNTRQYVHVEEMQEA